MTAMLFDLRANTGNWYQRVLDKDQKQTVLHGDYHRGNMFQKAKADGSGVELALFDFSFIGAGNATWELMYFLFLGGGRPDPEQEARLLEAYHEALMIGTFLVSSSLSVSLCLSRSLSVSVSLSLCLFPTDTRLSRLSQARLQLQPAAAQGRFQAAALHPSCRYDQRPTQGGQGGRVGEL